MLILPGVNPSTGQGKAVATHRPRDVYFCASFQRGECNRDEPHTDQIGADGVERTLHHICSSCLLKDGKKLGHPNGAPACLCRRNN